MARITVEDCVDKFPSRFELVLVASHRARELYSGETPTIDRDNDKNTVIALREIANTTIPIEKLKENLIEEYQTVTLSDEEDENLAIESLENHEQKEEFTSDSSTQIEEEIKEFTSDSSTQIEEEIKELTLAEDKDLKEKLDINEDLQSSANTPSSENDEQETAS